MMKFIGVRLPVTMVKDLDYMVNCTGTSRAQFIRQGILAVISEFYRNEEIKQKNQENYENKRNSTRRRSGSDWISLPDEW